MATTAEWVEGARLRTLPMAIAPVLVGSAAAFHAGAFHLGRAVLALVVALLLQIGVNYANDYSDGIRGTDDTRVGPQRLVGSGAAAPAQVKLAAFACFGVAMLAGLALVIVSGAWWFILVGVLCVLAAWGYTGGKHPYGYLGLGDVFVFVFFGLVATWGTMLTQAGRLTWEAGIGGISTGLIAVALLMANNVRDIPSDVQAGKKTLAVRLGQTMARRAYALFVLVGALLPLLLVTDYPWVLLVLLVALGTVVPLKIVLSGQRDRALIPVLRQTGFLNLGFAVVYSLVLILVRGF